jgi:hypothetical protein
LYAVAVTSTVLELAGATAGRVRAVPPFVP